MGWALKEERREMGGRGLKNHEEDGLGGPGPEVRSGDEI
jgi:hypothetical protein